MKERVYAALSQLGYDQKRNRGIPGIIAYHGNHGYFIHVREINAGYEATVLDSDDGLPKYWTYAGSRSHVEPIESFQGPDVDEVINSAHEFIMQRLAQLKSDDSVTTKQARIQKILAPPVNPTITKSWRDYDAENDIIRLFPFRPTSDDIIDLYQKAKDMRSNKLINLARERSSRVESITEKLIKLLTANDPKY
jgi:hypothetical protein